MELIILPIKFPKLFQGFRRPYSTYLLFGPTGCGKKTLVQACAAEVGISVIQVEATNLFTN